MLSQVFTYCSCILWQPVAIFKLWNFILFFVKNITPQKTLHTVNWCKNCGEMKYMYYINKFTTLVVHFGAVETNSQPKYANNGFEWYKTSNRLAGLTQCNIVVRTCAKVIFLAKLHLFYTITILYLLFLGMQCFKY